MVTTSNFTLAASQTRSRMIRETVRICRATFQDTLRMTAYVIAHGVTVEPTLLHLNKPGNLRRRSCYTIDVSKTVFHY